MERIPDLQKRTEDHARYIAEQGTKIASLFDVQSRHESRLTTLETAERARQIAEARGEERDKSTAAWQARMEKEVGELKDTIRSVGSRLAWTVLSAVVLAFITWALSGGMKLP